MLTQQMLSGLASGFIYALLALGFATVYRSMRVINFAQGDLFMAGAFVGLFLAKNLQLPFLAVLVLTGLVLLAFGMVFQKFVLAPASSRTPEVHAMIRTVGLSVVLQGVAIITWGTEEYRFPQLLSSASVSLYSISIPVNLLFIAGASVVLLGSLAAFLTHSQLGLCMRAASQNRLGAEVVGINVSLTRSFAFGLSASLGGIAGVLIAPLWYVHYSMGVMMGLKGFTAAVLGSLGSFPGAVIGGLTLGVIENLTAGYVSSVWKDAAVFAILIAVLTLRPQGILGLRYKERV
jgi:branched-chain amino acid transport system permease protein